jgi:hypothetical protein
LEATIDTANQTMKDRKSLDSPVLLGKMDEKKLMEKAKVEKEIIFVFEPSFIWKTLLHPDFFIQ